MSVDKEDDGWVEIDFDKLPDYVDLTVSEDDEDDEVDEDAADDVSDDAEDEEIDETAEDGDEEPKRKTRSRAEERIPQLVAREKAAANALREAQAKIQELEDQNAVSRKASAEAQTESIKRSIDLTSSALKRAQEDGDIDKVSELTSKLINLSVDQRISEAQAKKFETPAKKTEDKTTTNTVELPEELKYWLEDNSWVLKPETDEDKRKVRAVRTLSRELTAEGYLETEGDFYTELDARLQKAFASKGGNGVKYKEDVSDSSSQDGKRRKASAASGSSRTPASRRTRISLSPEERAMAVSLNLDPKSYALRKKAREDSKDGLTIIN